MSAVPFGVPRSGCLLYLHILPVHFGRHFVAKFGPETFTFLVNVHSGIPELGQIIPFAQCRALKEAKVVSAVPTSTRDLDLKLTTYATTVNAHPIDGTIIDLQTMNHLQINQGWQWLTVDGRVRSAQ